MTKFYKWLLFISSYAPLYFLLAINNYNFDFTPITFIAEMCGNPRQVTFWIVITVLFSISLVSVSYFEFIGLNERRIVNGLKPLNESVLSYLITYVIPLTAMDISSVNSLLVNALLFIIIGIVYVKSELVYLNILLILLGFRVYNDSTGNVIITNYKKDDLTVFENSNKSLLCRKVVRGVYLLRRPK